MALCACDNSEMVRYFKWFLVISALVQKICHGQSNACTCSLDATSCNCVAGEGLEPWQCLVSADTSATTSHGCLYYIGTYNSRQACSGNVEPFLKAYTTLEVKVSDTAFNIGKTGNCWVEIPQLCRFTVPVGKTYFDCYGNLEAEGPTLFATLPLSDFMPGPAGSGISSTGSGGSGGGVRPKC